MNLGARWDMYNPNDVVYLDLNNPLVGATERTKTFTQFSPRLGISHPIDEYTVLHFSYGHFFERGNFGDYGEGILESTKQGNLTTLVLEGTTIPWMLGNRLLKPMKSVQYEVGVERNFFDEVILMVTAYYKDIRNTVKSITVESTQGFIYRTNGNSAYGDERGVEFSLKKQQTRASWGSTWGFVNYSTRLGIGGRAGDPDFYTPTGARSSGSGDYIIHNNPQLKAGLFYQTPEDLGGLANILSLVSLSVYFDANFPNDQISWDHIVVDGLNYNRPVFTNTQLRLRKDLAVFSNALRLGLYVEVDNLFNVKHVNLGTFENVPIEDKRKMVESDFKYIPSTLNSGAPIVEPAKYLNLPRSVLFGVTAEF